MKRPNFTQTIVGIFVLGLLAAFASRECHGEEVTFAVGSPMVRGAAVPAVDLSWRFASSETDAYWQAALTLVGESQYDGATQKANGALQFMYVDGFGPVDLGVGVALLQNTDRYNGSHANFSLKLAYTYRRYFVEYRHWSNAGTGKPNLGRDILFFGRKF